MGAAIVALCAADAPPASAVVSIKAKFFPAADVGDWLIRTTVLLFALAATLPAFARSHVGVKFAPGVKVEGTVMFCGNKSDVPETWTVIGEECCKSFVVLLWFVTLL